MNIFKKINLFIFFKNKIKKIKDILYKDYNIRVDSAYRLYTVLNIPDEYIKDPYDLRKNDIELLSDSYIRNYLIKLAKFLNSNNLLELYNVYDIKKIDKKSYLIIIGFSLFRSDKFYITLYITLFFIILFLMILTIIIF